jgi:uncharacterized protein (TIGR03435 family)
MDRKPGLKRIRTAVLFRFPIMLAAAGLGFAPITQAQTQGTRPQFEVATIKPSTGGGRSSRSIGRLGDFEATNLSLKTLITEAYQVTPFEVYGGPGWIGSDTFDITAKPSVDPQPGPTSNKGNSNKMYDDNQLRLQTLLEDRFALKVHRETKELPVYALVVAKGGIKVKPSDCVKPDGDDPPSSPAPGQSPPAFCGNTRVSRNAITGTGITMADFLRVLSRVTDRTVIDRSGYTQTFNGTLQWASEGGGSAPGSDGSADSSSDTTGASLFTALQEQLGLKLESTKGPVEVLVIDHVEKPTPN